MVNPWLNLWWSLVFHRRPEDRQINVRSMVWKQIQIDGLIFLQSVGTPSWMTRGQGRSSKSGHGLQTSRSGERESVQSEPGHHQQGRVGPSGNGTPWDTPLAKRDQIQDLPLEKFRSPGTPSIRLVICRAFWRFSRSTRYSRGGSRDLWQGMVPSYRGFFVVVCPAPWNGCLGF